MSEYQPKTHSSGVRVTVEATVAAVWPKDDLISLSNSWDVGLDDAGVTVEKVAPSLPTTPGSAITFNRHDGLVYSLEPDGWRNTSRGWEVGQSDMQRMADRYGFNVLHDAGQVTP